MPAGIRMARRIVRVRYALKCLVEIELTSPTWSAPISTRAWIGRFSTLPKTAVTL